MILNGSTFFSLPGSDMNEDAHMYIHTFVVYSVILRVFFLQEWGKKVLGQGGRGSGRGGDYESSFWMRGCGFEGVMCL